MVEPGGVDAGGREPGAAAAAFDPIETKLRSSPGVWSVLVVDSAGTTLFAHEPDRLLAAASVAKLPLLLAAAEQMTTGSLSADEPLTRPRQTVGDSGIWQHLRTLTLPAADVARLIGIVSDNEATNALLDRLGGPAEVMRIAGAHGPWALTLRDRVRAGRGPDDPPVLGEAAARGCVEFWLRVLPASSVSPAAARLTRDWLRDGVDTSMALAPLHLDPLAHTTPDRGWSVLHKTGTDLGVRADTGVLCFEGRSVVYAALANWTPDGAHDPHRDAVMDVMHTIGRALRDVLRPA